MKIHPSEGDFSCGLFLRLFPSNYSPICGKNEQINSIFMYVFRVNCQLIKTILPAKNPSNIDFSCHWFSAKGHRTGLAKREISVGKKIEPALKAMQTTQRSISCWLWINLYPRKNPGAKSRKKSISLRQKNNFANKLYQMLLVFLRYLFSTRISIIAL